MTFRKWLTSHETAFVPTSSDDPELNGLIRGLAHYKPPRRTRSKLARRIDRLFGKVSIESTTHSRGAGVVFTTGNNILLLLRSNDSDDPNTWCLPGGGAQNDETPRETAKRECSEEIGVFCGDTFSQSNEDGWVFFFNKVKTPFKCKLNKEHTKWKWVNFDELNSLKLHPMLEKKIGRYIKLIKSEFDR